MENKKYNNQKLAQDYFIITNWPYKDCSNYRLIRNKISGLDIDIASFYQEHGSLEELNVVGIGKKTKRVLELILGKGKEKAEEIIKQDREKKAKEILEGFSFKDIPSTEAISDDYAQREIEEEGLCDNIARS
ncbi:MAG: hypothetical protein KKA64_01115, partial [Nanoarchaeota archaeon]|nr:hypothetical protein [Nanoarchaeota archaeon]